MYLNSNLKKRIGVQLLDLQLDKGRRFFEDKFPGNLASKTKDVLSGIPDLLNLLIQKFFVYFLSTSVSVSVLFGTSQKYATGLALWVVLYVWVSIIAASKGAFYCLNSAENRSKVIGNLVDIMTNISTVRLFNSKTYELRSFENCLVSYTESDKKRDLFFLSVFFYQGISFVIYQGLCLFWLVHDIKIGVVSSGDFALVILINTTIISAMTSLSWEINKFSTTYGDIFQALDALLTKPDITSRQDAAALVINRMPVDSPLIEFRNVFFSHVENTVLFENLSLKIFSNERIGIVGYSGSGKSTFVSLLLRDYEEKKGEILVAGRNISSISLHSLRENISFVPQDPSLFHRSLEDNIRYGRHDATIDEIIIASKKAHAHDFIMQLALGYQAVVGDRGIKLSGGQRQRISIARAILKDAPILILDEATSQVDSVTECLIQDHLLNLMLEKTAIVIAHRLSTLLKMDRILVFSSGKIVGNGSHEYLLSNNDHYKKLWETQVEGFMPNHPRSSLYEPFQARRENR